MDFFLHDEPLSAHTTFKIGGPADLYAKPEGEKFPERAAQILSHARNENIPLFILGAGSNVLAADAGFRGIILDVSGWRGCAIEAAAGGSVLLRVNAGTRADEAADFALENSLSGLEFLAGLPGTIGGAVWMNARCYEKSISDILAGVEILDESLKRVAVPYKHEDYAYKKSPFQTRNILIVSACLHAQMGREAKNAIRLKMETYRKDRDAKKHFSYPSAGSVFKNDHRWGKPAGKIIEELGLRGTQIGGARLADWHGNFIINTGNASARDVSALIALVQEKARQTLGIELEPEIVFLAP
ncbi:MAG: UDP-N-acetylmuramate dehydrogenase [Spirochaetaceae bacterium]|nr:UDP-N-acetylmuramate dehydrogenase [Spirochaetaceae bacterium]